MTARLLPYRGILPRIAPDAFLAPGVCVIGDVAVGSESSLWFGVVARGDVAPIRIGARTSVQDATVVHTSSAPIPTIVGDDVTVGHACILHACTVEDRAFVGMGSIVMDGAVIESGAMLGAGSLLPAGGRVPAGELWLGRPARFRRRIDPAEAAEWLAGCRRYVGLAAAYRAAIGADDTGSR